MIMQLLCKYTHVHESVYHAIEDVYMYVGVYILVHLLLCIMAYYCYIYNHTFGTKPPNLIPAKFSGYTVTIMSN